MGITIACVALGPQPKTICAREESSIQYTYGFTVYGRYDFGPVVTYDCVEWKPNPRWKP